MEGKINILWIFRIARNRIKINTICKYLLFILSEDAPITYLNHSHQPRFQSSSKISNTFLRSTISVMPLSKGLLTGNSRTQGHLRELWKLREFLEWKISSKIFHILQEDFLGRKIILWNATSAQYNINIISLMDIF